MMIIEISHDDTRRADAAKSTLRIIGNKKNCSVYMADEQEYENYLDELANSQKDNYHDTFTPRFFTCCVFLCLSWCSRGCPHWSTSGVQDCPPREQRPGNHQPIR